MSVRTTTYSAAGTYTFTTPPDVTSIDVECWGAGGGGGGSKSATQGSGGGGGGGYSKSTVAVSPKTGYQVVVGNYGAGGSWVTPSNGSPGSDSTFATTTVVAKGGSGGQSSADGAGGGAGGVLGTGDTRYDGGDGYLGTSATGGGGGSSGGTASNGTDATSATGAVAPAGGGNGGDGKTTGNGGVGVAPGGGGGGSRSTISTGGNGAVGKVVITYNSGALSAYSSNGFETTASSTNHVHITCSADNSLLVASVATYDANDVTVSSLVYHGDAMTPVRSDVKLLNSVYYRTTLFILVNPDTGGSWEAVYTLSEAADYVYVGVVSFIGALQTDQPEANAGNTGTVGPAATAITTLQANSWIVDAMCWHCTDDSTPNSSFTAAGQVLLSGETNSYFEGAQSYWPNNNAAGAKTMSWDLDDAEDAWTHSVLSIYNSLATPPASLNMQVYVVNTWKPASAIQIRIGGAWKTITKAQIQISGLWKTIFGSFFFFGIIDLWKRFLELFLHTTMKNG